MEETSSIQLCGGDQDNIYFNVSPTALDTSNTTYQLLMKFLAPSKLIFLPATPDSRLNDESIYYPLVKLNHEELVLWSHGRCKCYNEK